MNLKRTIDGTTEPVSYALAQEHLRLDGEDDQTTVDMYIKAARQAFEYATSHIVTSAQTWTAYFECWQDFRLSITPVISVSTVQYYDSDDAIQTYASSNYWVETGHKNTIVSLKNGVTLPSLALRRYPIIVTFTAGYADINDVPGQAKEAILLLTGNWYENRQHSVLMGGASKVELPMGWDAMVRQMKVWN